MKVAVAFRLAVVLLVIAPVNSRRLANDTGADAVDDLEADTLDGKIPTPELEMLADITDHELLHNLFLALEVPADNTVTRLDQVLVDRGNTPFLIKSEGLTLLPLKPGGILGLFPFFFNSFTRLFWTGKRWTWPSPDTEDKASYWNEWGPFNRGIPLLTGYLSINNIAGAFDRWGEDDPGDSLPYLGDLVNKHPPAQLDDKQSFIIDYTEGDLGWFWRVIDECRPLSEGALSTAGVTIPDEVDVAKLPDTWLCRSYSPKGLLYILPYSLFPVSQRSFLMFFALQFDLTSIEDVTPK